MVPTRKLYDENPKITQFTAKVLKCSPCGNHYLIQLDQTAFFPEEGGQEASHGTLDLSPVLHVKKENDIILHKTNISFPEGSQVTGCIDWNQRFDQMQQHTGEHIISGLIHDIYGYDNVGFHLGSAQVTLDFNGILSKADLDQIEEKANQAIYDNLDVVVTFPNSGELSALTYRSKIEITGQVRIVTIPGYDVCACCAPHVSKTGEIGMIRITGVQNYKGGVRVTILCGKRALFDYRKKSDSVTSLSVKLSTKPQDIVSGVEQLEQSRDNLKERLIAMQETLLQTKIDALPKDSIHVLLTTEDLDSVAARKAVNHLSNLFPGYCCICTGNDTKGYRYVLGSTQRDCHLAASLLKERFCAKGGGTSQMIQGSLSVSMADFTDFFTQLS